MIELEPGERAYMVEMRMRTTDAQGCEVLVGLTEAESDFYVRYSHERMDDDAPRRSDADRFLALNEKHERARFQVLGAEHEPRVDQPTRN